MGITFNRDESLAIMARGLSIQLGRLNISGSAPLLRNDCFFNLHKNTAMIIFTPHSENGLGQK